MEISGSNPCEIKHGSKEGGENQKRGGISYCAPAQIDGFPDTMPALLDLLDESDRTEGCAHSS